MSSENFETPRTITTSNNASSGTASGAIFMPPPKYGALAMATSAMRASIGSPSSTVTRTSWNL